MAIFPVLELERIVQSGDKTRLDGQKSFVSHGAAIAQVEIKSSRTASYIDVSSPRYLDWAYGFTIEVDSSNNKLNFSEGGPELTATITSADYTLGALANEIKTQMDTAGALTYVVSVDSDGKYNVSAGANFSLLVDSGSDSANSIFSAVGFSGDDLSGSAAYTGSAIEEIEKTVSIRCTVSGNQVLAKTLTIISEAADGLYSSDAMLLPHEPDILRYVRKGRASFIDVHRRSQELILAWLDEQGYTDDFGHKFTKASLANTEELQEWSTFMTLRLIFEGISNAVDDVFREKSKIYKGQEVHHRQRLVLRLDLDGDGSVALGEEVDLKSGLLLRR